MEPASREQIVAIIRQRADRLRREVYREAGRNINPGAQGHREQIDALEPREVVDRGPIVPIRVPAPARGIRGIAREIANDQRHERRVRHIEDQDLGGLNAQMHQDLGALNAQMHRLNAPLNALEHWAGRRPLNAGQGDAAPDLGRRPIMRPMNAGEVDELRRAMEAMDRRFGQPPVPLYRQATIPSDEDDCGSQLARTTINVSVDGDVVSYASSPDHPSSVGLYICGKCLKPESNYFEVEVLDRGFGGSHSISLGVVNHRFPLDTQVGRAVDSESIAYHTGEGALFRGGPRGQPFGERCEIGDRIGCGIKFPAHMKHSSAVSGTGSPPGAPVFVQVFFTRNGKEIPSNGHNMVIALPQHGFFPAISMQQSGEEVSVKLPGVGIRWAPEEDIMMLVDSAEDDWLRLHDIRLNGPVLEYIGRGKSLVDVGLAQAKTAICTRNHYFEIEIVDPGSNCYIAIGLARKDYPKNRHPGWNKGSIAYHADDGKVFVGSGVGAPFGPRCHKGDIMGCGVLFPRNYECKSDSEEELEQQGGVDQYGEGARAGMVAGAGGGIADGQNGVPPGPEAGGGDGVAGGGVVIGHNYVQLDYASDSGEDDDWWNDRNYIQSGVKVEIYFTRNGNVIGKKDIRIPKGGFYPTVGMMSCDEKVRVDLRPLSG